MSNFLEPGTFHLFYGPMNSGKTKELINHMNFLRFTKGISYLFFKPEIDTRDEIITSRDLHISYEPIIIPTNKPEKILEHVKNHEIIAIDEIQFFEEGIREVVKELMERGIQIVGSGLNLDFRGETYKEMKHLIPLATHPHSLVAVCQFQDCNNKATRTQRLINNKPAPHSSEQDLIEGSKDVVDYESRCMKHHIVPK